jgi:hypothetical protein
LTAAEVEERLALCSNTIHEASPKPILPHLMALLAVIIRQGRLIPLQGSTIRCAHPF